MAIQRAIIRFVPFETVNFGKTRETIKEKNNFFEYIADDTAVITIIEKLHNSETK